MANGNRSSARADSSTLFIVVVVVAVLYFARTVFIPLALSILLSFMLAPLVIRLRHCGLGRIPSTMLVVLTAFGVLGIIGAVMTSQLADLAHKLPDYQHNIHQKLESIRNSGGGLIKRVSNTIQTFTEDLTPPAASPATTQPKEERPVPVEIRRTSFSPMESVQKVLGSVVNILLTTAIVIVFVIFMLIQQEDLRDRLIRLAGSRQVNLTTNMLDDAANRVSRYLLAQFVVNAIYGVATGTVLYFIGVPNPWLWAMLAVLFRYIPYLGIWLAAIMPAAVAFAVNPGWVDVPIVFGVYFGVDLLMYNLLEPLLYGSSTGLSPLAILVAAVFWTWLWGGAGLLLATPLTVCVVVIGRHVPSLTFLEVLLSDEPVLPAKTRLYQRLLAMDSEEAKQICEEFLKMKSLDQLYDEVLVPALSLAEEDRHRGKLDEEKGQFIFQHTRALVEDMAERCEDLVHPDGSSKAGLRGKIEGSEKIRVEPVGPAQVVCVPARDEADEIAALMLKQLLQKRGIAAKTLPFGISAASVTGEITRENPKAASILAVPPFAYMQTRYLCRRLRHQFRSLKLVSGILTENGPPESKRFQGPSDESASSLKETLVNIVSLIEQEQPKAAELPVAQLRI